MKRTLLTLFLTLAVLAGAFARTDGIIGKWIFKDMFLEEMYIIEFTEDRMIFNELYGFYNLYNDEDEPDEIAFYIIIDDLIYSSYDNMVMEPWAYYKLDTPDSLIFHDGSEIILQGTRMKPFNSTTLSGKYTPFFESGLFSAYIESLDFYDDNRMIYTIRGSDENDIEYFNYEIYGAYLLIRKGPAAAAVMEIIGDNLLRGDVLGTGEDNYYLKREN